MSDEHRDLYYNDSQGGFDPSNSYMSFTDCLHGSSMDYHSLSKAFGMSPSSSEVFNSPTKPMDFGGENLNPVDTPNSSVSFSSSGEEDSGKQHSKRDSLLQGSEDGPDCSKKE